MPERVGGSGGGSASQEEQERRRRRREIGELGGERKKEDGGSDAPVAPGTDAASATGGEPRIRQPGQVNQNVGDVTEADSGGDGGGQGPTATGGGGQTFTPDTQTSRGAGSGGGGGGDAGPPGEGSPDLEGPSGAPTGRGVDPAGVVDDNGGGVGGVSPPTADPPIAEGGGGQQFDPDDQDGAFPPKGEREQFDAPQPPDPESGPDPEDKFTEEELAAARAQFIDNNPNLFDQGLNDEGPVDRDQVVVKDFDGDGDFEVGLTEEARQKLRQRRQEMAEEQFQERLEASEERVESLVGEGNPAFEQAMAQGSSLRERTPRANMSQSLSTTGVGVDQGREFKADTPGEFQQVSNIQADAVLEARESERRFQQISNLQEEAVRQSQQEQFGDFDWSFGLFGEGDEAERFVDEGIGEGGSRFVSEFTEGAKAQAEKDGPTLYGPGAGLGDDLVISAANVAEDAPKVPALVLEGTELGVEAVSKTKAAGGSEQQFDEFGGAVGKAAEKQIEQQIQFYQENPQRLGAEALLTAGTAGLFTVGKFGTRVSRLTPSARDVPSALGQSRRGLTPDTGALRRSAESPDIDIEGFDIRQSLPDAPFQVRVVDTPNANRLEIDPELKRRVREKVTPSPDEVDLGRPLPTDLGETPLSTRSARALGNLKRRELQIDPDLKREIRDRITPSPDEVDLGRPLATDIGEQPLSTRFFDAVPKGPSGITTSQVFGRAGAPGIGTTGFAARATNTLAGLRSRGFTTPGPYRAFVSGDSVDLGRPLPTDLGEQPLSTRFFDALPKGPSGIRTDQVFGRAGPPGIGNAPLSTRFIDALPTGPSGIRTDQVFGRAGPPGIGNEPLSTRFGAPTGDEVDLGRPLATDVGEQPLSTRFIDALPKGPSGITTSQVFGRAGPPGVGTEPLLTRLGAPSGDKVDLGRPLATDLGEQPLSTRFFDAVPKGPSGITTSQVFGRAGAPGIATRGFTTRAVDRLETPYKIAKGEAGIRVLRPLPDEFDVDDDVFRSLVDEDGDGDGEGPGGGGEGGFGGPDVRQVGVDVDGDEASSRMLLQQEDRRRDVSEDTDTQSVSVTDSRGVGGLAGFGALGAGFGMASGGAEEIAEVSPETELFVDATAGEDVDVDVDQSPTPDVRSVPDTVWDFDFGDFAGPTFGFSVGTTTFQEQEQEQDDDDIVRFPDPDPGGRLPRIAGDNEFENQGDDIADIGFGAETFGTGFLDTEDAFDDWF